MNTNIDYDPTISELNNKYLELSYKTKQENAIRVSMAANYQESSRPQNVNNEAPPTHVLHEDDIINIQLLYDLQALTEPEL